MYALATHAAIYVCVHILAAIYMYALTERSTERLRLRTAEFYSAAFYCEPLPCSTEEGLLRKERESEKEREREREKLRSKREKLRSKREKLRSPASQHTSAYVRTERSSERSTFLTSLYLRRALPSSLAYGKEGHILFLRTAGFYSLPVPSSTFVVPLPWSRYI